MGDHTDELVTATLCDSDFGRRDEELGQVSLRLDDYDRRPGVVHELEWLPLQPMPEAAAAAAGTAGAGSSGSPPVQGELKLKLQWRQFVEGEESVESMGGKIGAFERAVMGERVGKFINACIVLNFGIMAAEYHGMSQAVTDLFEVANLVLTLIFALEMFLKLAAIGLVRYFADSFNRLDAFIVVTSLVELAVALFSTGCILSCSNGGGGGGAFTALRTFRERNGLPPSHRSTDKNAPRSTDKNAPRRPLRTGLLRILRSLKLIQSVGALKDMINTTAGSLKAIGDFAILLFIMLYIYALVGLHIFGGKITEEGVAGAPSPRANFDTLLWSFTTVFMVMTRENWQSAMFDAMHSAGTESVVYFVSLIVLTNYILLSLFIGTLLENFERFFLDSAKEKGKRKAQEKRELSMFTTALDAVPAGRGVVRARHGGDGSGDGQGLVGDQGPGVDLVHGAQQKSLRQRARELVKHDVFEGIVLAAIVASSGCLAIEHPLDDPESTKSKVLGAIDLVFVIFFCFEAALKLMALGLVKQPDAYFRSPWNWIDFVIVVSGTCIFWGISCSLACVCGFGGCGR
jgi:hypothetical protein